MTQRTSAGPRIAVLGGGIGGLASAAFLRREGLEATVYEQAPRLAEVGAGVVVAPNAAARLLRRLGVLGSLRTRAVQLTQSGCRKDDGAAVRVEVESERRGDRVHATRVAMRPHPVVLVDRERAGRRDGHRGRRGCPR